MDSLEIHRVLVNLPNHTIGVYPSDMIPETWEKPVAFVFNTDNSKKPGSHWVAVYVDKKSRGHYFDSYGLKPYIPDHIARLRKNCKTFRYNDHHLQSISSDVCGHFCIMFLFFMASGIEFQEFINLFSRDTHQNDAIVREFVENVIAQNTTPKNKLAQLNGGGFCKQTCRAKNKLGAIHI